MQQMTLVWTFLHTGMLSSAATQDNRIPGKIPDFFLPNNSLLLLGGIGTWDSGKVVSEYTRKLISFAKNIF